MQATTDIMSTESRPLEGDKIARFLSAPELYDGALIENIRPAGAGDVLTLDNRLLVENDAPAAGLMMPGMTGLNYVDLTDKTWAVKTFYLEQTDVKSVRLAVLVAAPAPETALLVEVNGHQCEYLPPLPDAGNSYSCLPARDGRCGGYGSPRPGGGFTVAWLYLEFSPEWLRPGTNDVRLGAGAASGAWRIAVANDAHYAKGYIYPSATPPGASRVGAVGDDGMITWSGIPGEYCIRLAMEGFRASGRLITPVIDLAQAGGPYRTVLSGMQVQNLTLEYDADVPSDTRVELRIRTAASPVIAAADADSWELWEPGSAINAPGRFMRCQVKLLTECPLRSPALRGLQIAATFKPPASDWIAAAQVCHWRNPEIIRPSFKYEYEHYNHALLQKIRADFDLDRVVADARDEFGKILCLLHWAYRVPLREIFDLPEISWNALDYLIPDRDPQGGLRMNIYKTRRRDCYCLNSNLALMQALLSFGLQARHIAIAGHEVCEVWSNTYGKWVHLDATREYYCYDQRTKVPLNVLEIQDLYAANPQAIGVYPGMDNPHPLDYKALCEGQHNLLGMMGLFRIIPRNNFLEKPYPRPFNHGYRWPWPWNGYLVYDGPGVAPQWQCAHAGRRARDFYWTLNRVGFAMQATRNAGVLDVWLDTETPDFDAYLARIDGGPWREIPGRYAWNLHAGENHFECCARNRMGVRGPASEAVLDWS